MLGLSGAIAVRHVAPAQGSGLEPALRTPAPETRARVTRWTLRAVTWDAVLVSTVILMYRVP